jgi:hypothetical protein
MSEMAESIRITQDGIGRPVLVEIDGAEFPWHTMGEKIIRADKDDLTGVTVTIPAKCVEFRTVQGS